MIYKCEHCGYSTLVRSNMKGSPSGTFTCRGIPQCNKRFEGRVNHARDLIERCERDLRRVLPPGERRDLLMDNTDFSREAIVAIVERFSLQEVA